MTISANCKINIGLDILARREDGFHELSTVMYPVGGLADRLTVERLSGDEVEFCATGIAIDCPEEQNLCVRAARLMQQRYGAGGVHITLEKNIPFGAGLGGGSADATAVVKAINNLYSLQLSQEQLVDVASQLGSDTPFFVYNTPQLCTSRGEVTSPVDVDLSGYNIVLVKPDIHISTAEAYSGVRPKEPQTSLQELISLPVEMWQGQIKNDFEEHIFKLHPSLSQIKEELLKQGALYASMSGSGSAIYGIFGDVNTLDKEFISRYNPYIL